MIENRYKLNTTRLINLWFLPFFILILTLFIFFSKFDNLHQARKIEIIAFTFFLIFFVGIFVFLFLNHLKIAIRTELIVKGKQLILIQGEKEETVDFNDITQIREYTANRLPWGRIIKWCLTANGNTYTISSLTISQLNFERYFYDKIESKTTFFPTISY